MQLTLFVRGVLFRLLSKPCPPDELSNTMRELLLYRSKVLHDNNSLDRIMNEVVRSFTSVLAAALPLYFGRSQRVMRMASEIGRLLKLVLFGEWTPACLFALGFATLPPEVQLRAYRNEDVKDHELEIINSFGSFSKEMLSNIPRMDEVMGVVDLIGLNYCEPDQDDNDAAKLASVIRLARHYDFYASKGQNRPMILNPY